LCQRKYHPNGEKIGFCLEMAALCDLKKLYQAGFPRYNNTQKNYNFLQI